MVPVPLEGKKDDVKNAGNEDWREMEGEGLVELWWE